MPKFQTYITITDNRCRFEFATNEFINDMAVVSLETAGTETGTKEFIAVGTSINRGEDLAVKGAVSLFPHSNY